MKLIRFGEKDNAQPGLLKEDRIVALRSIFPDIPDIGEDFFRDGWLKKVADVSEPGEKMDVPITCPVRRPSKILCLGKNYAEHAKEGGAENPEKPLIFCKTLNTLSGPFDPILLPKSCKQIDWEVELAIVVGRECKRASQQDAMDYIAGFTVMNDVSGREAQFSDDQWYRGKSFDTFAPMGPALVTTDEFPDVNNLRLTATVDGVVMQDGNTGDLIFDIPYLIEYISQDITLIPGDIISTGTPSGVGIFRNPPVVLESGNVVECHIEGIGSIINPVVSS
ncbi:MAG: fumarylacetoacetate hydrolase family protein [Desulfobacterales bacterium]